MRARAPAVLKIDKRSGRVCVRTSRCFRAGAAPPPRGAAEKEAAQTGGLGSFPAGGSPGAEGTAGRPFLLPHRKGASSGRTSAGRSSPAAPAPRLVRRRLLAAGALDGPALVRLPGLGGEVRVRRLRRLGGRGGIARVHGELRLPARRHVDHRPPQDHLVPGLVVAGGLVGGGDQLAVGIVHVPVGPVLVPGVGRGLDLLRARGQGGIVLVHRLIGGGGQPTRWSSSRWFRPHWSPGSGRSDSCSHTW